MVGQGLVVMGVAGEALQFGHVGEFGPAHVLRELRGEPRGRDPSGLVPGVEARLRLPARVDCGDPRRDRRQDINREAERGGQCDYEQAQASTRPASAPTAPRHRLAASAQAATQKTT